MYDSSATPPAYFLCSDNAPPVVDYTNRCKNPTSGDTSYDCAFPSPPPAPPPSPPMPAAPPQPSPSQPPPDICATSIMVDSTNVYQAIDTPYSNSRGVVNCYWLDRNDVLARGETCSDYVMYESGATPPAYFFCSDHSDANRCKNPASGDTSYDCVIPSPSPAPPPSPPLPARSSMPCTFAASKIGHKCEFTPPGQPTTLRYSGPAGV